MASKTKPEKKKTKFGDGMALGDFMSDLKLIMGGDKKKKKMLKADTDEEDRGVDNDSRDSSDSSLVDSDTIDENSISSNGPEKGTDFLVESLASSDAGVREAANRILSTVNSEVPDHTSTQPMGSVPIYEEDPEPDETSSLLGHTNEGNDSLLRPSIFSPL